MTVDNIYLVMYYIKCHSGNSSLKLNPTSSMKPSSVSPKSRPILTVIGRIIEVFLIVGINISGYLAILLNVPLLIFIGIAVSGHLLGVSPGDKLAEFLIFSGTLSVIIAAYKFDVFSPNKCQLQKS